MHSATTRFLSLHAGTNAAVRLHPDVFLCYRRFSVRLRHGRDLGRHDLTAGALHAQLRLAGDGRQRHHRW